MLNKRADKLELLRIAEAVALEKSIDKELIINSMETGIAKAAKSKFGYDNEIKVLINRDNGDIEIFRKLIITENPENSNTEIKLKDAINLSELNKNSAFYFCENINKDAYQTILEASEEMKKTIRRIVNSPESKGDIPFFTTSVIDKMDNNGDRKWGSNIF